ncbi:unnamed protein product, partial [Staurois parvus]
QLWTSPGTTVGLCIHHQAAHSLSQIPPGPYAAYVPSSRGQCYPLNKCRPRQMPCDQCPDDQCSPINATCHCPSMPPVSAHQCTSMPHISAYQCTSMPHMSAYQ